MKVLTTSADQDLAQPRIALCLLGPCSDRSRFRDTAEAVLRQDYAGGIVLLVPDGATLETEWMHIGTDVGRTLVVAPRADTTLALDCNAALVMALALDPPVEFLALLRCGERPSKGWLSSLWRAQEEFDADLVAGPVKAVFDDRPPDWMIAGGFLDRLGLRRGLMPRLPAVDNSLIRAAAVRSLLPLVGPNPAANDSEWIDLAFRAQRLGLIAAWANDAMVFDPIPRSRMTEQWVIDRAYSKAYAAARAQHGGRAGRTGEKLRRVRAFTLLLAGLVSCGLFRLDRFRLVQARLMLAHARGTLDGCAAQEHCRSKAA
ncbi:MAG: hypothetical protein JO052_24455 [Bradyrhizobium sp.]|nr:hypothetical protein [Bradyrhizobium sp.]